MDELSSRLTEAKDMESIPTPQDLSSCMESAQVSFMDSFIGYSDKKLTLR